MKRFQNRIPKLAKELSSKNVKEQISVFLDEYLKYLQKNGSKIYFDRLEKKVGSALEL